MIQKRPVLLLFTLSLLLASCRTDELELAPIDRLPPATRSGEYTFGCLVNGEAFVPETTRDITAIYQWGILQLSAEAEVDSSDPGISIDIYSPIEKGRSYDLTNEPFEDVLFDEGGGSGSCRYGPENTLLGSLTITHFDSIDFIISGTFEFTTATEGCDTIRVTDGRFDIPYIP